MSDGKGVEAPEGEKKLLGLRHRCAARTGGGGAGSRQSFRDRDDACEHAAEGAAGVLLRAAGCAGRRHESVSTGAVGATESSVLAASPREEERRACTCASRLRSFSSSRAIFFRLEHADSSA